MNKKEDLPNTLGRKFKSPKNILAENKKKGEFSVRSSEIKGIFILGT